jgi:hypothetical protein
MRVKTMRIEEGCERHDDVHEMVMGCGEADGDGGGIRWWRD